MGKCKVFFKLKIIGFRLKHFNSSHIFDNFVIDVQLTTKFRDNFHNLSLTKINLIMPAFICDHKVTIYWLSANTFFLFIYLTTKTEYWITYVVVCLFNQLNQLHSSQQHRPQHQHHQQHHHHHHHHQQHWNQLQQTVHNILQLKDARKINSHKKNSLFYINEI